MEDKKDNNLDETKQTTKKTNKTKIIKKITTVGVLIALSVVLSLFDRYISMGITTLIPIIGIFIPTFKLGIANIVILIIIYNYKFGTSFLSVVLKSLILGLFAGYISLIIGFTGTIMSFIVMYGLSKILTGEKMIIIVSAVGGFTHSLGQIIAGFGIYGLFLPGIASQSTINTLLLYSPLILLLGIITGVIIGFISLKINQLIKKNKLIN